MRRECSWLDRIKRLRLLRVCRSGGRWVRERVARAGEMELTTKGKDSFSAAGRVPKRVSKVNVESVGRGGADLGHRRALECVLLLEMGGGCRGSGRWSWSEG